MNYHDYRQEMEKLSFLKKKLENLRVNKLDIFQKYNENYKKYCKDLNKEYRKLEKDEKKLRDDLVNLIPNEWG